MKSKRFLYWMVVMMSVALAIPIGDLLNAAPQHHTHHHVVHHPQSGGDGGDFQSFIAGIRKSAQKKGVSEATLEKYVDTIKSPGGAQEDSMQLAYQIKFHNKLNNYSALDVDTFVLQMHNLDRIQRIRMEFQLHRDLLLQIYRRYQVPPGIILALWAIESDFGQDMGNHYIIQSLAKLAYHNRRASYFREQLIDALMIFDKTPVFPPMLLSTFDGGMGQPQFEPESYQLYSVDFENHGFSDIWTSHADVFASIAHFLHLNGWKPGQPWGLQVKLPQDFPTHTANVHVKKSIDTWTSLGVTNLDGSPLKKVDYKVGMFLPGGLKGPAFLLYPNFYVLFLWNRSTAEATLAAKLAYQCECNF